MTYIFYLTNTENCPILCGGGRLMITVSTYHIRLTAAFQNCLDMILTNIINTRPNSKTNTP